MRHLGPGILSSPRLAVFLTLLAAGLVSPQAANAGCSAHYLTRQLNSMGGLSRLELLGLEGVVSLPPMEAPVPQRTPCSGVFCSGNPGTPVPAVPSIPSLTRGEMAIPNPLSPDADQGALRPLASGPSPCPISFPSSIFHPPR